MLTINLNIAYDLVLYNKAHENKNKLVSREDAEKLKRCEVIICPSYLK